MIPRVAVSIVLVLVLIVPIIAIVPLITRIVVSVIHLFTGNHHPKVTFVFSQNGLFELPPV